MRSCEVVVDDENHTFALGSHCFRLPTSDRLHPCDRAASSTKVWRYKTRKGCITAAVLPSSPLSWRIANRSRESCTGHPVATKTRHRHRRLAQCEVAHGSFRAHRQAPVVTTQARQDKEKRRRAACYGSPGRRRHASSPECLPRAASALGERAERRPIRQHPCPCCRPEWRVPRPPMTCELAPYGSLQRESHVRSRPRAAGTESLLGLKPRGLP